ncbi:MAG: shikimate kinase AroK [Pseudomonadales bacterium]|nr:shikimate kinase AroK [Pseudomonadales bacterium]
MQTSNTNIFLVGLMAVGKTTVGKYLAKELNMDFFDSDRVVEEYSGADISWIFDKEGEDGFREREAQVIDELTQRKGIVLATGGGVVLREDNRKHLGARGTVVYLTSSLNRLVERAKNTNHRPLLQGVDAMAIFQKLQRERGPLYREIADYEFSAEQTTPKILAGTIIAEIFTTHLDN